MDIFKIINIFISIINIINIINNKIIFYLMIVFFAKIIKFKIINILINFKKPLNNNKNNNN